MKQRNMNGLLNRLSESEERFLEREFLAPALRDRKATVAIDGVRFELETHPKNFEGWGIFQPESHTRAKLVREASLADRQAYLSRLPLMRMILCGRVGRNWAGVPLQTDGRYEIVGTPPIHFVEIPELFNTVRVRFDGMRFWFDGPELSQDPTVPGRLLDALDKDEKPDEIDYRGLTAQHRLAYTLEQARRNERKLLDRDITTEARLREALEHGGGSLVSFAEHSDGYRVTWRLQNGQRFVSSINESDLSVQVAGICLDGEDRKFDLTSLVSVYQEAERDEPWVL